MHKFIISTLLFTSFSLAGPSYSFLGAQTSYLNYDHISSPSLGLKYGIQKDMWRTTLNLDYGKNSDDKLSSFIIQADKGILQSAMRNSSFKPYVGFSLGVLEHKNTIKDKGYGIGLNTGISYLLNGAIDLDLGYRYLSTSKMNNISSLNSVNLSLHYFY